MLLAHHLLQYHRHLLLVDDVARGGHIRLRVAIIHRRIHTLDGTRQHLQHGILVLQIRNHIRGIYSGERLIMSVLEERRRADCHRTLRGFEEREEVGDERVGQLRTQEVAQYLFVGGVAERYLVQIVLLHKLVEDVRTQHHCLRNLNRHAGERTEVGVHLYDIVKESQTSALSSERSVADAGEVRVRVKLHTVEHSHHADVLHVAILHDGVEDNLTVSGDVLQTFPRDFLQKVRHGEDGTRREPAAHVVARDMIEHRVVRYAEYVVLQLLEVMYAHNLRLRLRVAEDEVAEAHVLLHDGTEVQRHLLRVLVNEAEAFSLSLSPVLRLRAFHDERQEGSPLMDDAQKLKSSLRVLHATERKAHVADDAQHVVGILIVKRQRLLIVARQHHLGTSAHTQRGGMAVERLRGEALALCEDVVVEIGKNRTVEADAVLHEQYHLHATLLYVVLEVHLVLDKLDDGEDEVGVAEPAEHIVEDAEVLVLHAFRYAVRERREHHVVHVRKSRLYVSRHRERVVVGIARHADNEVDVHGAEHLVSLLRGAHLREGWRIT